MPRKRAQKVYLKRPHSPGIQHSSQASSTTPFPEFSPAFANSRTAKVICNPIRVSSPASPLWSTGPSESPHKLLILTSGSGALLALIEVVTGYQVVTCDDRLVRDGLTTAMLLIAVVQVGLAVQYAVVLRRWQESLRQELRLDLVPIKPLCRSKRALALCLLECCFHVFVPLPKINPVWTFWMVGISYAITLDHCLYVCVLLRTYKLLRYLFWLSPLSTRKAKLIVKLTDTEISDIFVARYLFTNYSFMLLLGLYLAVVGVSGVSVHILESGKSESSTVNNAIWLVAQTQSTIGYGDIVPQTFFAYIIVTVSCLVGNAVLSLLVALISRMTSLSQAESSLYTHMAYTQAQRRDITSAVLVIQAWWRLMRMRLHHTRDALTITHFYTQQRAYRSTLQACERCKDHRFEGKIEAFQHHVARECRSMIEYLQPVLDTHSLVAITQATDFFRAHYNLMHKAKQVASHFRPRKGRPHITLNGLPYSGSLLSSSHSSALHSPSSSPMSEAKAKAKAQKKLICRLIKEDSAHTAYDSPTHFFGKERSYPLLFIMV